MLSVLALLAFVANALAWDGWSNDTANQVMGMNLGSYFVPETWMMQEYTNCYAEGVDDIWGMHSLPNASDIMINHLNNFIREVDFADAQKMGINMVRVPVAFWMFIPTEGDEPYWTDSRQKDVYLVQILNWAKKYGMEVLIDIHAMPGGQNTDAHSGRNLVAAGLLPTFLNSTNLARGNATVDAVIKWIQELPQNISSTIAIIELVNEPSLVTADSYEALAGFYIAGQAKVAAALPNVWTMIGDAWLGVQSWGDVFSPSQKVVMDLHWWNMFANPPPTLNMLEIAYCSLSPPAAAHAWKNPILIGEFSAVQNNPTLYNTSTKIVALEFYQSYYATQLWAARGSGGALPLYRGGFIWNMICTNCGDVWSPYYISGGWDSFVVTEPNWCNVTATGTATATKPPQSAAINPTPVHDANRCGIYTTAQKNIAGTGTATSSSSTSTSTKKGAANGLRPSTSLLATTVLIPLVGLLQFF